MLDKLDIVMYHKTAQEHGKYQGAITDRINHILREVFPKAVEGFDIDWWDWPGGSEYNDGHISNGFKYDYESIDIECSWTTHADPDVRLVIDNEISEGLYDMLFMDDDEIVDYILAEIQALKDKKTRAEVKRQENKVKKDKIKQTALEKLSSEERKALGVT